MHWFGQLMTMQVGMLEDIALLFDNFLCIVKFGFQASTSVVHNLLVLLNRGSLFVTLFFLSSYSSPVKEQKLHARVISPHGKRMDVFTHFNSFKLLIL